MSDFVQWWFEEHWFWSTMLTPGMTFAWCCFKGLFWRGAAAFVIAFVTLGSAAYKRN